MRSQEPFSYEQHQDAADLLARLHDDLARLGRELERSYGDAAAADAQSALSAIERLRTRLHAQLDRDFPRDTAQVSSVRLGSIYSPPRWVEQRLAG